MTEYKLSLLATEHLERNKAVIAGFNLKYGQGRTEAKEYFEALLKF